MSRRRRILFSAAMFCTLGTPAAAQTTPRPPAAQHGVRPYVFGGLMLEDRVLDIRELRSWHPAPVAGGGVWLNRFVGVEATAEISARETFDYTTSYDAPIRHRTGTHRDAMVLGSLRVRPACPAWICVEAVAGFGLGLHHTSSLIREECGIIGVPTPCAQVNRLDWSESERTSALSFGLDAPLGPSSGRVVVMPSLRVSWLNHTSKMHLNGAHEPSVNGDWFFSAGAIVAIR